MLSFIERYGYNMNKKEINYDFGPVLSKFNFRPSKIFGFKMPDGINHCAMVGILASSPLYKGTKVLVVKNKIEVIDATVIFIKRIGEDHFIDGIDKFSNVTIVLDIPYDSAVNCNFLCLRSDHFKIESETGFAAVLNKQLFGYPKLNTVDDYFIEYSNNTYLKFKINKIENTDVSDQIYIYVKFDESFIYSTYLFSKLFDNKFKNLGILTTDPEIDEFYNNL